jgi:hypothetical protein
MYISELHPSLKVAIDKTSSLSTPPFEPEELDLWLNKGILKFVKTRYSGVNLKKESFEETQKRTDDLHLLVKTVSITIADSGVTYEDGRTEYVVDTTSDSWPSDYMFAIQEEVATATVNEIASVNRWGVIQCDHDQYRKKIEDPFSEHILHYGSAKPIRLFDSNNVHLITDGNYTLAAYYLTYLRKPQKLNTIDSVASGNLIAGNLYEVVDSTSPYTDTLTYNTVVYNHGDTFRAVASDLTFTSSTCEAYTTIELPLHTHEEVIELTANMMLENIEQPRYTTHANEVATME